MTLVNQPVPWRYFDAPTMLVVETFVIRDGVIVEIRPYFDTATFAAR